MDERQLFNICGDSLFHFLSLLDVKNLTLVSSSVSDTMRRLISHYCSFSFSESYKKYNVQRMIRVVANIPFLPPLSHLHLHCREQPNILFSSLPSSLSHLVLHGGAGDLSSLRISHLTLKSGSLPKKILYPPTLSHLTIDCIFQRNQFSFSLPKTLKKLTFGNNFDQSIDCLHSLSITHLYLGEKFNFPIDNLPVSLTHLIIGNSDSSEGRFHQAIDKLPPSLLYFSTSGRFSNVIKFPSSLQTLIFKYSDTPIVELPSSLLYLQFENGTLPFAPNLQTLKIMNTCLSFQIDTLPLSLTSLKLGVNFNSPVDNLPANLLNLEFGDRFNQPVIKLPDKIQKLTFGDTFNQCVDHLPESIAYLKFGQYFNQTVDELPMFLVKVEFYYKFVFSTAEMLKKNKYVQIEYTKLSSRGGMKEICKSCEVCGWTASDNENEFDVYDDDDDKIEDEDDRGYYEEEGRKRDLHQKKLKLE